MPDTIILSHAGARATAHRAIDAAPDGYVVTIGKPGRSSVANRRFHAMVGDLIRCQPEGRVLDNDCWKVLLMNLAAKSAKDPRPFQMRHELALDGEGVVLIGPRTSRLKVGEFAELIEVAKFYGDTHGVIWSEPNPYEEMMR
jgi:hypothetical protein